LNISKSFFNKLENDLHFSELFKGGSVSFILKIIGLALGYIFSLVVARSLGAESWGIYSLCLAIVTISSIFARFGFDTTIMRLNAEYKALRKEDSLIPLSKLVFKISFLLSVIISIIVFLFADFIAEEIFNKINLSHSIRIVSLAITPFSLSLVAASALKGFKQITKAVFIEYVAKFAFMLLLLIGGLIFFDLDKQSIVPIIVIASWLMFGVCAVWYFNSVRKYKYEIHQKIEWKPILKIALPLILASSVLYLKGWIDTITIGIYLTEADVGIYNIAQKLANFTVIPLITLSAIAAPKFAESKINLEELKLVLIKTSKLIILFSTPIFIGLIIFSEQLLRVFGPEFIEAEFVLVIISIAAYINAIFGSLGYLLQMTGFHVAFQNSVIVLSVLALVLNIFLIPRFGIIGAAYSTLMVNLVWNLILIVFVSSKLNLRT
jgi:O-antigen/teichoic acid export membrane protein